MKQNNGKGLGSLLSSDMPAKHNNVQRRRKKIRTEVRLTLGQLIQNYRDETGLSLRELAQSLEISRSMLSLIERDRAFPSRSILQRIAKVLDSSSDELRKLDTRLQMSRLRRVIDKSPELTNALRFMLEQVSEHGIAPQRFAAAIFSVAIRR